MDWQTPGGLGGLGVLGVLRWTGVDKVYSMGWAGDGRMSVESIGGDLGAWRALEHQNTHEERVLTLSPHTYWWVRAGVQQYHHEQYSQQDPQYIKTTTQQ